MEYIYAALLLHKIGKEINEEGIKKIVHAAGAEVDESKVKTLVASLKGVDINKALEEAVIASASSSSRGQVEPKKEEKKEEEKREIAAEGLSALFG